MIALLQRVSHAEVAVGGERIAAIGRGLLVFAAAVREDTPREAARLAVRICDYRVFPDHAGRMNRSLADIGGEVLLVPQFTLAADTRKGTRPSFTPAADPARGRALLEVLAREVAARLGTVHTGRFGADMQVTLCNDGPVTIWLEARPAAAAHTHSRGTRKRS